MDERQPGDATKVATRLILEQSAHCDWDWVATFYNYYSQGYGGNESVEKTLSDAINLMLNQPGTYFYSFCELAYLREYVTRNPGQLSNIKKVAESLTLASGGMTSAENLLTHGEAFIRNYLVGRHWATHELEITPSFQMWIPDDFGHDAQLPIVLHAMGFKGVAFWRIGGNHPDQSTPPQNTPAYILTNSVGLDFVWQAHDGSQVQVHWLNGSYCQGNQLCSVPNNGNQCDGSTIPWNPYTQSTINGFILPANGPARWPTPYRYVPIDCDFCTPFNNVPDILNSWNTCNQSGTNCQGTQPAGLKGYVAEMGSFDKFMHLVHEYTKPGNPNGASLDVLYSNPAPDTDQILFLPNPYYSGCYGSRPELKVLHYQTTRTLLLAETLEIIVEYLAFTNAAKWVPIAAKARSFLAKNWQELIPSTHHDYITGTSPDPIYKDPPPNGEQLYYLTKALSAAQQISTELMQELSSAATLSPDATDITLLVFNPVGFARAGVVEMQSPGAGMQSASLNGQDYFPVQYNQSTNTLLFTAENNLTGTGVPSLGYATLYLTTQTPNVPTALSLEPAPNDPGSYILSNEFLSALVTPAGVTELFDIVNDPSKQNNLLGSGGTQIVFYKDDGNIYRFGNELPDCDFYLDDTLSLPPQPFLIAEQGQVRCTLATTSSVSFENQKYDFTTNYSLVSGEPFLRITITGAAPGSVSNSIGYSVMAKFSFASTISMLTYGTAYNWDTRGFRNYVNWPTPPDPTVEQITFEPTHEFVIPTDAGGNYLAAIYHAATPGWGIDSKGDLLGCILRNTPGNQNAGIFGTDGDPHTASLALRVAGKAGSSTQLLSPDNGCRAGAPLGEAFQFNNPLVAVVVPQSPSDELPPQMSVASTRDPQAVISAAKMGTMKEREMILRVYQPTNSPLAGIDIALDANIARMYQDQAGNLNVGGKTALELPLADENLSLNAEATSFTYTAPFALTTLALKRE